MTNSFRMLRRPALLAALMVLSVVGLLPAGAAPAPQREAAALTVVSTKQLTPRLQEHVVRSTALGGEATVRVQLPTGYDARPAREWPMALLLHGRSENARTWSEKTDLPQFDGMVVVMPDGGRVGWYTNWYDDSCCGPLRQRWASFHIGELLPWADAAYRLADGRSQRFVAGDSMGGFGAMSYAARHPDLFGGAAELSGFVDLMLLEASGPIGVDGQSYQVAGIPPGSVFGPSVTEEVRWRGRNPVDLAENLRATDLVLRHGNGLPGREGESPDAGETAIRLTGLSLHERLAALDIDHVWDDYGNGVHSWPYWERGLQQVWPRWLAIAKAGAPAPESFSYRAIEPVFDVYGWHVALERPVLELAVLDVADGGNFSLTGSGSAVVTTPASFRPHRRYAVQVDGVPSVVRADREGRLRVPVDLGPAHTAQQYTPAADAQSALPGYFRTVAVQITG